MLTGRVGDPTAAGPPAPKRLGLLTPSSNTVLEPTTARLVAPLAGRLSVHVARFRVTSIADEPASARQFALEPMLEAAQLLADAGVDAMLWSGTSGSWLGLDADRRFVDAIASTLGLPVTTATLALLDVLETLGARRYGLVVPYVEAIAHAIIRNLAEVGLVCTAWTTEGLTLNHEFASVPPSSLAERVREVARSRPDTIVIQCTNLRGEEIVAAAEQELGIPVLDSVAVGLRGALALLDLDPPSTLGRLAGVALRPTVPAGPDHA